MGANKIMPIDLRRANGNTPVNQSEEQRMDQMKLKRLFTYDFVSLPHRLTVQETCACERPFVVKINGKPFCNYCLAERVRKNACD